MIPLMFLTIFAGLMCAQNTNTAAPKDSPAPPVDRLLTREEVLMIENSILRLALAQKNYKIEQYQAEVAHIVGEQESVIAAACKSVGVPADRLKSECGMTGFGQDGRPVVGPDGKPVSPRVWWAKPSPPVAEKK